MPRTTGYGGTVTALDSLPLASFGGIAFPVLSAEIKGGIRNHIHEYPHSSGGAPEKLGRSLYHFSLQVSFDTNFRLYPGLWPDRRDQLLLMFERQETADLVVPTFNRGPVPAFCANWTLNMAAKIRSGERATLEFIEDNEKDISKFALARASDTFPQTFEAKVAQLTSADLAALGFTARDIDLLSAIQQGFRWVQSVIDTGTMAVDALRAKLDSIAVACSDLLTSAQSALDLHSNYELAEQIRAAWSYAIEKSQTLVRSKTPLTYVVPNTMPMSTIAARLYGDPSKAGELLENNAASVRDAFAVPAGTSLLYFV